MAVRIEKGLCGICPAGCGVTIELRDDCIHKIGPWKGHIQGYPCVRGLHTAEIVHSPDRLKTPLKRSGPKGGLDFDAISWDQALDEIATRLLKLKARYGPECLASFIGRGHFEESLQRMFTPVATGNSVGSSILMPLGSPNSFNVGSLCFVAYGALAPAATFGAPMSALAADLENAEIIFVWGTNPATNSPPTAMARLKKAKQRGARIVVIDPVKTAAAKLADDWVPIQPGTDMALIYGILRCCLQNKTLDMEFGQKFCRGFNDFLSYADRFDPLTVAQITRVPEASLARLAHLLGSTPKVALLTYTGLEYSNIGVQTIRALLSLWALTGHLDFLGGQRMLKPVKVPFPKPEVYLPTAVDPIGKAQYPYFFDLTGTAQFMEFPRSVLNADPYKIRALLIGGASILTSFPNTPRFEQALAALDYQVSIDIFLNADARYADIVLPATTYFEITSLRSYMNVGPDPFAIQYRKPIVQPVGQSLSNYLIYAHLAERLGYGHLFPQTEQEMIRFLIQDLPIGFETFKQRSETGPIPLFQNPNSPYEERKWQSGGLRKDQNPGFNTPSGKWEITSTALESSGYNPLPHYEDMAEGPARKELAGTYPLTLTTGARLKSAFRSQHLNIPGLLKMQPAAEVLIHTADARKRGITTGDRVRVSTARGNVNFIARVSDDILEGVVEVNQGGGSPIQATGWRDSNVNRLTDDQNRDPVSGFPTFKALLCEVEKV